MTIEKLKIKFKTKNNTYIQYLPVKERKFKKVKVKIIRHEDIRTN